MSRFNIKLRENPIVGDSDILDVTRHFTSWKHSIRDVGGDWLGEGEFAGTESEIKRFFLENLGKRLVVGSGGIDWWEGQIARIEYTHKGQRFVRSLEDMSNRVKVIFSRVGPNLFSNPNVESGAWTQVGSPSTHETTTDWWARGTTAMHVVSAAINEGTMIENGVSISASTAYTCSVILNVVSGPWKLQVDDGSGEVIAERSSAGMGGGQLWLSCQIPATNTYTSIRVRILSTAGSQEMYADGAILRLSGVRSETKWHVDTDSRLAYGRKETVLLEREMTNDEADGVAQRELAELAWLRTRAPRKGQMLEPGREAPGERLVVTCMGMAWTLAWRHSLTDGTDQADNHITALLDESEFIASSDAVIDTNTAEVYLDTSNPVTLWDQIEKVIDAGDGSGGVWMGGVYPGQTFRYEARPTATQYQFSNGRLEYYGGGWVAPLEFYPHWCYMTDMPAEPVPAGGDTTADDPRRVWLPQTWFVYKKDKGRDVFTLSWETEE